jgi:hypothetical protein
MSQKTTASTDVFARLRRPEYTGENRCTPCTVVNLAIAAVVSALSYAVSPLASVVVAVVSVSAIYLRGYLVPGTPSLTARYFPEWLLAAFGKASEPTPEPVDADTDAVDIEAILVDMGALTDGPGADLTVTPAFTDAWVTKAANLYDRGENGDPRVLSAVLEVAPDRIELARVGDAYGATVDGRDAGVWESRAAFVADVAADGVLREREDWTARPIAERSLVLGGLRLFLERCPACDGVVSIDDEVVRSCCQTFDVVAATCEDCDARLFETTLDAVD